MSLSEACAPKAGTEIHQPGEGKKKNQRDRKGLGRAKKGTPLGGRKVKLQKAQL